jgi:hypothetical protein
MTASIQGRKEGAEATRRDVLKSWAISPCHYDHGSTDRNLRRWQAVPNPVDSLRNAFSSTANIYLSPCPLLLIYSEVRDLASENVFSGCGITTHPP